MMMLPAMVATRRATYSGGFADDIGRAERGDFFDATCLSGAFI